MTRVRCKGCGRRYSYETSGCCPHCGAYNRPPHRQSVKADGTVYRVQEGNAPDRAVTLRARKKAILWAVVALCVTTTIVGGVIAFMESRTSPKPVQPDRAPYIQEITVMDDVVVAWLGDAEDVSFGRLDYLNRYGDNCMVNRETVEKNGEECIITFHIAATDATLNYLYVECGLNDWLELPILEEMIH